jgi:hypothetical protein
MNSQFKMVAKIFDDGVDEFPDGLSGITVDIDETTVYLSVITEPGWMHMASLTVKQARMLASVLNMFADVVEE